MKTALMAASAVPLARIGQVAAADQLPSQPKEVLPTGKIGSVEFSRLMLGGNMMGGMPTRVNSDTSAS